MLIIFMSIYLNVGLNLTEYLLASERTKGLHTIDVVGSRRRVCIVYFGNFERLMCKMTPSVQHLRNRHWWY